MKHFLAEMILTCPSDWTLEKCREYVERILPTQEEKDSLTVVEFSDVIRMRLESHYNPDRNDIHPADGRPRCKTCGWSLMAHRDYDCACPKEAGVSNV